MTLLILVIAFLSTGSTSLVPQQDENPSGIMPESIPTLTVCEALSNASAYDGKMVRIRNQVRGTDEGTWFVGEDCPGIYVTDGKIWPSSIALTSPTELDFIIHPVNFTFDRSSRQRIETKWRQLRKHLPDRCIAVTYTGMFESWTKESARKPVPGGWMELWGFGHLSGAPAQLVLKSADDVEAIPNCKASKSGKDSDAIKKK